MLNMKFCRITNCMSVNYVRNTEQTYTITKAKCFKTLQNASTLSICIVNFDDK